MQSEDPGRTPRKKEAVNSESSASAPARASGSLTASQVKKSIDKRRELVKRRSAGSEGRDIAIRARRDLTEEFESVGEQELITDQEVSRNRMATAGVQAPVAGNAFWETMGGFWGYKIGALTEDVRSALSALETNLGTRIAMESEARGVENSATDKRIDDAMNRLGQLDMKECGDGDTTPQKDDTWRPRHIIGWSGRIGAWWRGRRGLGCTHSIARRSASCRMRQGGMARYRKSASPGTAS